MWRIMVACDNVKKWAGGGMGINIIYYLTKLVFDFIVINLIYAYALDAMHWCLYEHVILYSLFCPKSLEFNTYLID